MKSYGIQIKWCEYFPCTHSLQKSDEERKLSENNVYKKPI